MTTVVDLPELATHEAGKLHTSMAGVQDIERREIRPKTEGCAFL